MAVKTFYVGSGNDGNFGALFDGVAQTAASRADGWTVGKIAAGNYAEFDVGVKQATGTFNTTPKPASFLTGSTANALKTPAPLTGTFANTSWQFNFAVRATVASAQTGKIRIRVFRSVNADGSGATEVTTSTVVSNDSGSITTTADAPATFSTTIGSGPLTLNNEYLFFVIAWSISIAGGSNTADVVLRTGSTGPAGSRIVTPDFVAVLSIAPAGLGSAQNFGAISTAKGVVSRTMVGLASPQAFGAVTIVATGPPQTVQVPGVYPPGAVYQQSITGAVIVGDGHVVGGAWSYAAQFGTVTAKNVTITPAGGVGSASAFGTVTVRTAVARAVTGLGSAQTFGSLAFRVTVGSGGVLTAQAFGVPVPKSVISRQVGSVPSSQQFGAVTVTTVTRPAAGGVPSAQAFGTVTPIVVGGGLQTVPVTGKTSAQQFGTLVVKATITRQVGGVTSAQAFGTVSVRRGVPSGGVPSAQQFGTITAVVPAGPPQTVPVQGVNPYVLVTSITGQVICGDGHLVGTSVYALGMFGAVGIYTTVARQVGGVSSTAAVGSVRAINILQPNGIPSAQQFGVAKALPGPVRLQLQGITSGQLFGRVTPHRYDLHVTCKPEGGLSMPPSTTGGFVLTPITEGSFVLTPNVDQPFVLTPVVEGDFVLTAVDEDG